MAARFLILGTVFGYVLSRAAATDYDAIVNMFLLRDLHLVGVIGVAVLVAGVGFEILRRTGYRRFEELRQPARPLAPGLILGSILFGAGWALTGTCPGTALAQLGELKLVAGFTLLGIVGGAAMHRVHGARVERWLGRRRRPQA
jgi:uncharacterized membrane protein YedE/YeeE